MWKSENSNKDLKTMKLYIEEKEMLTSSVDHQNTTETESQHKKKWMDEWINEWMDELLIKKKKKKLNFIMVLYFLMILYFLLHLFQNKKKIKFQSPNSILCQEIDIIIHSGARVHWFSSIQSN